MSLLSWLKKPDDQPAEKDSKVKGGEQTTDQKCNKLQKEVHHLWLKKQFP